MISLVADHDGRRRQDRGQYSSRFVEWTGAEPMGVLEKVACRLGTFAGNGACSYRKQQKGAPHQKSSLVGFLRKLSPSCGNCNKVQAWQPDWLNYDSQSYALNFEEEDGLDSVCTPKSSPMPTVSGPGARKIVAVLLRRSVSANRNCGSHLIPKPVSAIKESRPPLWKRRCVQEPALLRMSRKRSSYGT